MVLSFADVEELCKYMELRRTLLEDKVMLVRAMLANEEQIAKLDESLKSTDFILSTKYDVQALSSDWSTEELVKKFRENKTITLADFLVSENSENPMESSKEPEDANGYMEELNNVMYDLSRDKKHDGCVSEEDLASLKVVGNIYDTKKVSDNG